jgi:hypothetical protein
MLILSQPVAPSARPIRLADRLLALFRSPASGVEVQNRPKRVEELPEPALRDLGLGREEGHVEPQWDPQLPFFLQARYGRKG